jgi:Cys-rich protein (TIGR01571 family)
LAKITDNHKSLLFSNKGHLKIPYSSSMEKNIEKPTQPLVVQASVVAVPITVSPDGTVPVGGDETLIPYPGENKFHHEPCDRCCEFGGDCCLAWWAPCFSLAHVSAKLKALGDPFFMDFNVIMVIGLIMLVVDVFIGGGVSHIYSIVLAFLLRSAVRKRLSIEGNVVSDCCCAFWCLPCVVTQINGTLWRTPADKPGCNCGDHFAHIV